MFQSVNNYCTRCIQKHFELVELINSKRSLSLIFGRNCVRLRAMNTIAYNICFPGLKQVFTVEWVCSVPWNILLLMRIVVEKLRVYKQNVTIINKLRLLNSEIYKYREGFYEAREIMYILKGY